MKKFGRDCNGDGLVDCRDFAILHKTGYRNCHQSAIENSKYWKDFTTTQCFRPIGNRINQPNTINNRYNQPNIVRNVFHSSTSSSSSSTVRNVRRTITNNDNNFNSNEHFNHNNRFKDDLNNNNFASAFDNFDNHDNHFNNGHNFNELNIETNRLARPPVSSRINVSNRNNNFNSINNNNSIKPINFRQPISQPSESPNSSSIRVLTVNGNIKPINFNNNNRTPAFIDNNNLKLSNATLTIDNKCLNCISYASTKLNLKMKCNDNFNFCGPFLISFNYWKEGGSLENYVDCSNNFECAKQTVANYMARHNKDCDLNNELTCDDFAIIHQVGAYQCEKANIRKSLYWMNYQRCYYNDDFHTVNDESSVTGFSIISNPNKPEQPLNSINSNQINPPHNRLRNLPELNVANDWRPIEHNNNLKPIQPINLRPNQPPNNIFNQPRPINNNNQPRSAIQPINPPNNSDWIENVKDNEENFENSEENNNDSNNINNNNNNLNSNQPLSRSSRKPLTRPQPRRFERPTVENNSSNDEEAINNNFNSYNSTNNNNQFEPEIVPIENNRRNTSPRSALLTRSNVIPVQPNSPITTNLNRNNITISQSCLDCICEATSGNCLESAKCFVNNFGELVCGSYQLNRFFWNDAGKPENNGEADAFEQCASNRLCSQKTIIAYMNKYASDCNNDDAIDCMDFAAIVRTGRACSLQNLIDSSYWGKFQQCYGFGDD